MKTILRIITIVLIGILVAGATYLVVKNTSLFATESDMSDSERSAMPGGEAMNGHPEEGQGSRSEGFEGDLDHNTASLSRGLSEVLVSLAKIAGITIVVLLIQRVFT